MERERCERKFHYSSAPRKEVVPMSMFIEVWGDYACFSRPEMKTERVS